MPDNITPIDAARQRSNATSDQMYDLLMQIDELEELLESLDERGITTREELVARITTLEAEAARRESSTDS